MNIDRAPQGEQNIGFVHGGRDTRREFLNLLGKTAILTGAVIALPSILQSDTRQRDLQHPEGLSNNELINRIAATEAAEAQGFKFTLESATERLHALSELFIRSGRLIREGLPNFYTSPVQFLQRTILLPDFSADPNAVPEHEQDQNIYQNDSSSLANATAAQKETHFTADKYGLLRFLQKSHPQFYATLTVDDRITILDMAYNPLNGTPGVHLDSGWLILALNAINQDVDWAQIPALLPTNDATYFCTRGTIGAALRSIAFHEWQHQDSRKGETREYPLSTALVNAFSKVVNSTVNIENRQQDDPHTDITFINGVTHNFGVDLHAKGGRVYLYRGLLEYIDDLLASYRLLSLGFDYERPTYASQYDFYNLFNVLLPALNMTSMDLGKLYYNSDLETFYKILGNAVGKEEAKRKARRGSLSNSHFDGNPLTTGIRLFTPNRGDLFDWGTEMGLDWRPWHDELRDINPINAFPSYGSNNDPTKASSVFPTWCNVMLSP